MGFLSELNDAFMDGLKTGPSPSWFGGLKVKRAPSPIAVSELKQQHQRVSIALTAWHQQKHTDWSGEPDQSVIDVLSEGEAWACFDDAGVADPQGSYLFPVWREFVREMATAEPMLQLLAAVNIEEMAAPKRLELHEQLSYLEKVLAEPDVYLDAWSDHIFRFMVHLLEALPGSVRTAPSDIDLTLSCPLIDCLHDPHNELALILQHFDGQDSIDVRKRQLFANVHETMFAAVLNFSKMTIEELEKKPPDTPVNHTTVPAAELVPKFFGKTPFSKLLLTPVPYGS